MPQLSWGGFAALAELLRGLAYLVLAFFVAYLTWRHRRLIIAALRDLYSAIKDFWNGLRGKDGSESVGVEDHVAPVPVRRFADCPDPFQSAGAHSAAVVRSTLEGLEVWASEHGSPRNDDQTLEEFTRDLLRALSRVPETIQGELRVLVRLHDQIAYDGRKVTKEQVQPLKRLWATLRRYQAKQ